MESRYDYLSKVKNRVKTLCAVKPNRRTGSPGNQKATRYVASIMKNFGFTVDTTPFPCLDHEIFKTSLTYDRGTFEVFTSPYSFGCDLLREIVTASTIEELERKVYSDKILLMKGELTTGQLMPKNFVFYNPDEHKRIYSILETKKPAAIITATGKDLDMVGNLYPFPLIEDGDFDIPSVYCKDVVGDEIAAKEATIFHLEIGAKRIPSEASNVVATKNESASRKIVFCAHIDAKETTPGASDDASGIAVLLLFAELLSEYRGGLGIELVAFNGEDNYSAAGEMDYLGRYGEYLDEAIMVINIDDVGYKDGKTAYSFYEFPIEFKLKVKDVLLEYRGLKEGESWYSGDHMIFAQKKIPTMAITSEKVFELMHKITHTEADTPEILDYSKLVELAKALNYLVQQANRVFLI